MARLLAKSGISATIANSRGPELLSCDLSGSSALQSTLHTVVKAASADIVLVALLAGLISKGRSGGLPDWKGRIVIDGTNPVVFLDPNSPDAKDPNNPLAAYGIKAIDLGGKHSSAGVPQIRPGRARRQGIQPSRRQPSCRRQQ